MSLPLILAGGGAALVGLSLISDYKLVIGNTGLLMVKKVGNGGYMRPDAADAFNAMAAAAAQDGVTLVAGSAFRSIPEQLLLYLEYVARGFNYPMVAKPGTSNHGNGTAVDVGGAPGTKLDFASSGFRWLTANAATYGFNWDEARRMKEPEPWHWGYG